MQQELAACVAIAVTITPAFVFLATSTVMSECVFTLFQLATVLLIHRSVETGDAQRARIFTIGGGADRRRDRAHSLGRSRAGAGCRSLAAEGAALETGGAVWRGRRGLHSSLVALCTRSCTDTGGTCAAWWFDRVFVRSADLDALGRRSGIGNGDASRFPRASWSEHRRCVRPWDGRPVRTHSAPRSRRERRGDGGPRWCRRSGSGRHGRCARDNGDLACAECRCPAGIRSNGTHARDRRRTARSDFSRNHFSVAVLDVPVRRAAWRRICFSIWSPGFARSLR